MKIKYYSKILSLLFLLVGWCIPLLGQESRYHQIKELSVGDASGWNVLSLDETGRRLYGVTRSNIFVVDLNSERVVKQFTNVTGIHAFTTISRFKSAFYLKDEESKLHIVD